MTLQWRCRWPQDPRYRVAPPALLFVSMTFICHVQFARYNMLFFLTKEWWDYLDVTPGVSDVPACFRGFLSSQLWESNVRPPKSHFNPTARHCVREVVRKVVRGAWLKLPNLWDRLTHWDFYVEYHWLGPISSPVELNGRFFSTCSRQKNVRFLKTWTARSNPWTQLV